MPTEMATLSWAGTAWNTAVPEAGEHEDEDDEALEDDQAHRIGPGHLGGDGEGDEGVETQAGGQGEREVGEHPHEDRHQAGHQGGARGDGRQVGPIAGPPPRKCTVGVLGETEDQRVEDDDVGHREEGDDAAADLAFDAGAPFGDLEEAVEAARRVPCGWVRA
jgi:hypothetical protein